MEILVVKEFTFDSAHCLPNHPGACARMHGHTYRLQVGYIGPVNEDTGMVIDFGDLSSKVKEVIITKLDHALLNDLSIKDGPRFPTFLPTAELMVEWIVDTMNYHILNSVNDVRLAFVRLYETPTSYAEWRYR